MTSNPVNVLNGAEIISFSNNHGTSDFYSHEEMTSASEDEDNVFQDITSLSSSFDSDSSVYSSTSLTSPNSSCCSDCFCCSTSSIYNENDLDFKRQKEGKYGSFSDITNVSPLPTISSVFSPDYKENNNVLRKCRSFTFKNEKNYLYNTKYKTHDQITKSTKSLLHVNYSLYQNVIQAKPRFNINKLYEELLRVKCENAKSKRKYMNLQESVGHLDHHKTATLIMTEAPPSLLSDNSTLTGKIKFKVLKPCCRHILPFYYHHFSSSVSVINNQKKAHLALTLKKHPLFKKINTSKLHLYSTCILLKLDNKKCIHARNNAKLFAKMARKIALHRSKMYCHQVVAPSFTKQQNVESYTNKQISKSSCSKFILNHPLVYNKSIKVLSTKQNHHIDSQNDNNYQHHHHRHAPNSQVLREKLAKYYRHYKDIEIFSLNPFTSSTLPNSNEMNSFQATPHLKETSQGHYQDDSEEPDFLDYTIYKALKKFKRINRNAQKVSIKAVLGDSALPSKSSIEKLTGNRISLLSPTSRNRTKHPDTLDPNHRWNHVPGTSTSYHPQATLPNNEIYNPVAFNSCYLVNHRKNYNTCKANNNVITHHYHQKPRQLIKNFHKYFSD